MSQLVWQIECIVPKTYRAYFADSLCAFADSLTCFESEKTKEWVLRMFFAEQPDEEEVKNRLVILSQAVGVSVPEYIIEQTPDKDWVEDMQEHFEPVSVAGFFIYASWYKGHFPANSIPICIDPRSAFGTGHHETTAGCLKALQQLSQNNVFTNILDLGSGSGILAIAAAKLWPNSALLASDIDKNSITICQQNFELNATSTIKTACADGLHANSILQPAPYDLLMANILATPLTELAEDITQVMKTNSVIVLSGFYANQLQSVLKAYERFGFTKLFEIAQGQWRTLALTKT